MWGLGMLYYRQICLMIKEVPWKASLYGCFTIVLSLLALAWCVSSSRVIHIRYQLLAQLDSVINESQIQHSNQTMRKLEIVLDVYV